MPSTDPNVHGIAGQGPAWGHLGRLNVVWAEGWVEKAIFLCNELQGKAESSSSSRLVLLQSPLRAGLAAVFQGTRASTRAEQAISRKANKTW